MSKKTKEISTDKNLIFYSVVEVNDKGNVGYGGGDGYDYLIDVEGKRKLRKDTPTTQGYFVNTECPVVNINNVVNLLVGKQRDVLTVYLLMLIKLLDFVIENEDYKRIMFFTKHKFITRLIKLKKEEVAVGMKLLKFDVNKRTVELLNNLIDRMEAIKELDKRLLINLEGFVEGGLGVKNAYKQMELARVLASVNKSTVSLSVTDLKTYENPESDFNKVVDANRWYFDSSLSEEYYKLVDGKRVYDFGKVEPDKKYYGKFTPDVTYSRLYTKEPIQLLDKYFEFAKRVTNNENGYLQAGIIDNLNNRDALRLVEDLLVEDKGNIYNPITRQNNEPLIIETINPVLMSYKVREFLSSIDILYNTFTNRDKKEFRNVKFYDITESIFTVETNKRGVSKLSLNKDISMATRTLKFNVEHPNAKKPVPLIVSLGYDIPDRNNLNRVECLEAKMWLVVDTNNSNGIRYSTILETNDWTYVQINGLANLRILTLKELKDK